MDIHILLIEPDQDFRDTLRGFFRENHASMSVLYSASLLMKRLEHEIPAVILIRDGLPEMSTPFVLQRLYSAGYEIPVIVIGHAPSTIEKILCLELGADDYIETPCDMRELMSRIRNVVRRQSMTIRTAPEERDQCAFGDYLLDFRSRSLTCQGVPMTLRENAFSLLKLFVNNPMKVLPRNSLVNTLGGSTSEYSGRSIDVAVFRLRQVLELDPTKPRYIQTVRGKGYVFIPHGMDAPVMTRDEPAVPPIDSTRRCGSINLLGRYSFAVPEAVARGELRPLRRPNEV